MRRLGAAVCAVLALAGCADAVAGRPVAVETAEGGDFGFHTVFDEAALEGPDGVMKVLVEDDNLENVEAVDCPADQEVERGATFTCTVTVAGEGGELSVEITVMDDEGEYQVGLPE